MDEVRPRALGEEAAAAAPTAPHATPRLTKGPRTGPERFWARWPVRITLALCMVISGVAHCSVVPFEMPHPFEVNDVEGEAAIPVDLLRPEDTPVQPPPPATVAENPSDDIKPKDTGPRVSRIDAGVLADAAVHDAAADAAPDARDASRDTAPPSESLDAGLSSSAIPAEDAGEAPKDPQAIVGAVGAIQADAVLVMLLVNTEVIRGHVEGAKIGYLLRGIPQWEEFMRGTDIDPVRDSDWVLVSGPSLVNSGRDVVLVHYSVPDAVIDRAVDVVSRKYDRGGPIDAGVRGVRASLARADRAERVMLRAQPHLLAVVPPAFAQKIARQLVTARVQARIRPNEAVYLRLVNPHHPFPEIPDSITEIRLRVVARADQGADVFVDGDTKDADEAARAAAELARVLRRHNDPFVSIATHGLLDHPEVTSEGNLVKVHLAATLDQIDTLVTLTGVFLGIGAPEPAAPAAPVSPKPSR